MHDDPKPVTHGWICDTTLCHCVPVDGAGGGIYSNRAECERNCCPPPKTPGYICKQVGVDLTHFECIKVDDGAEFKSLRECQIHCLGYPFPPPTPITGGGSKPTQTIVPTTVPRVPPGGVGDRIARPEPKPYKPGGTFPTVPTRPVPGTYPR